MIIETINRTSSMFDMLAVQISSHYHQTILCHISPETLSKYMIEHGWKKVDFPGGVASVVWLKDGCPTVEDRHLHEFYVCKHGAAARGRTVEFDVHAACPLAGCLFDSPFMVVNPNTGKRFWSFSGYAGRVEKILSGYYGYPIQFDRLVEMVEESKFWILDHVNMYYECDCCGEISEKQRKHKKCWKCRNGKFQEISR